MNNNFENLYHVLKTFLPMADKYLANSPLEPYIPQIQNIVNIVESVGGIQTLNHLINTISSNQNQTHTNTKIKNKKLDISNTINNSSHIYNKKIDDYKRIN